jgi:hypothetical protein
MDDPSAIPAATVQDVDLSAADPAVAAEIRRLGELMERGDESPEQFAELIRLLARAGQPRKAEYLLRRNIEVVASGPALYRELFGTTRPDEFAAAVEGFRAQFGVGLELVSSLGFLDGLYRTRPGPPRSDAFRFLDQPREVRIDYADLDAVTANVWSESSEECLSLRWVGGAWQLADGGQAEPGAAPNRGGMTALRDTSSPEPPAGELGR